MELTETEQALLMQKAIKSLARAERKEFRKKVMELELRDGMVFQSTNMDFVQKHRRIIHAENGYCIYSDGGDTNKECQIKTLKNWIIYRKAKWNEATH